MSEQSVDRLMDVVLQMRINLSHITETLHQQTCEIRQQLDGVVDGQRPAGGFEVRGYLERTSGVGGRDGLGPRRQEVPGLQGHRSKTY